MANSIQVVIDRSGDFWDITATVVSGGILPPEIFIYENTGSTELGSYVGVCDFNELTRLQIFNNQALPVFGNRFVRYGQAKIQLSLNQDTKAVVDNLINTASTLKTQLIAVASTTTIYPI